MVALDRYQAFREAAKALTQDVMEALVDHAVLSRAGRALDVARGHTFVFESESEMNVVMDYALYEDLVDGQSLVQRYRDQATSLSPLQRELLDAMAHAYASLFRTTAIIPAEHALVLTDLLGQRPDIRLIDIRFSQTAAPGMLLFTRIVPLPELNMTTGMAFAFPGWREASLRRRAQRLSKRAQAETASARRMVAFFRLNRSDGLEVTFA
jgi:hypothetical protein